MYCNYGLYSYFCNRSVTSAGRGREIKVSHKVGGSSPSHFAKKIFDISLKGDVKWSK